MPRGWLGPGERPIHGRATDLDLPRDGGNPHVWGVHPLDLVVAVDPAGVARLAARRQRGRDLCGAMPCTLQGVEVLPLAEQEPRQGLAQVLHHVNAINDLDGLRCALPNALGVQPTAIAADALDTGVRLPPRRDSGGRALREQIHHVMALEIAEHGP